MTSSSVSSEYPVGYDDIAVVLTDPFFGMPTKTITVGEFKKFGHKQENCRGRNCVLHRPSDHPLARRPMVWRADTGVMERTCIHGVGHPDPDHMAYVKSLTPNHDCPGKCDDYPHLDWQGFHGCDGCC